MFIMAVAQLSAPDPLKKTNLIPAFAPQKPSKLNYSIQKAD